MRGVPVGGGENKKRPVARGGRSFFFGLRFKISVQAALQILICRDVGTYRPHPSRLRRATFPKGEGFWMRFARLTCRGCRGRQRPDLKSYAAACTPRAGAFLRQGACDQSKKGFLADFTTRRFVPVYSAFILFRINRHKTQVKSGGGSLEGGACSPLNGRQPDKSEFADLKSNAIISSRLRLCKA